jgi:hypothetical protein
MKAGLKIQRTRSSVVPDVHKRECAATGDPSQASTLSSTAFPHKKFSVRNSLYVLTILTVVSI